MMNGMLRRKSKKVFVGLSGGVDSSVAAALLKRRGYDVTGVFIKVWQPDFIPCTWKEDRLDAMRVAARLDIPFLTMDFGEEYKKSVVDDMIESYKRGETPNPDVMCNKSIKFGMFQNAALAAGADFVATGHYARLEKTPDGIALKKGIDREKDQSYFLWTLSQDRLAKTIFPVGDYAKTKVRNMARAFGLPTADKKDSQGLCFLGKLNMRDFLGHFIPEKRGDVLNEKGDVIGFHTGAMFLTLGQRHGFTVEKKQTSDKPYYIVAKNISENTITVSHDPAEKTGRGTRKIFLRNACWNRGEPIVGKTYAASIRYREKPRACKILSAGDNPIVEFEEPRIVSAGQSLVLYDNDICMGGGVVTKNEMLS